MPHDQRHLALLAFGANLPSPVGQPLATIVAARDALAKAGMEIVAFSPPYCTVAETLPDSDPVPDFINAAAVMVTDLAPDALLGLFQRIERHFGRTEGARWSARSLDIDLLAWDNAILPSVALWHDIAGSEDPAAILPEPVVPHPRLHRRGFVLAPLKDVAPEWMHPVLGQSAMQMYDALAAQGTMADIKKLPVSDITEVK